MRNRLIAVLVPVVCLLTASCGPLFVLGAVGGVGGGAYVWHKGWVNQTVEAPIDRVFRAAAAALRDADVLLDQETFAPDDAVLDGYDKDSTRVMIKLTPVDGKSTRIRVRIGLMGDQERSIQILDQLKKHL